MSRAEAILCLASGAIMMICMYIVIIPSMMFLFLDIPLDGGWGSSLCPAPGG